MRVMVLVKATKDSEAGVMPSAEVLEAMGRFNEDMDEAVAWVKRCPNPMPGPSEIETRPLFETPGFGDAMTPEVAEQEARIRNKAAGG